MAGRILIAVASANNRISLRSVLSGARYEVESTDSAGDAFDAARTGQFDLILTDPSIGLATGHGLILRLRSNPAVRRIPVIVLTAAEDPAAEVRIAALKAGADDVTQRHGTAAPLLARIRSHLRAADTAEALGQRDATVREMGFCEAPDAFAPAARVALIAHNAKRVCALTDRLSPHIAHPLFSYDISDALAEADRDMAADLFVIEACYVHPGDALQLLADLRARPKTRHAAIVVLHDEGDNETATHALDIGASDLMPANFHPEELALRIDIQLERKRASDRLRASLDERLRLAMEDPLTGLFNRRYALAHAGAQTGRGYCVILADIDRFKSINDTYGHSAGDAILLEFAKRLKDNVRAMDMVARVGGEEFLIFLPDPDPAAAQAAARRLCAHIHDQPFDVPNGPPAISVTASFGVAMGEPGDSIADTVGRADAALYEAKAAGRDTVTLDASCAA
ncbi:MAG: diguanylate cyclase [Pseudomonadota bacterium]